MITFKSIVRLTEADYQRVSGVMQGFTLNKINENLLLNRWEAHTINDDGIDLIIIWQVLDGWMFLLATEGKGIELVADKLKAIAKQNKLKGIELEAEDEAHKRFYEGFGLSVASYVMRVAV